jgi:hypothetical protein
MWTSCAVIVFATGVAGAGALHPTRKPAKLTSQIVDQVRHQEHHQSLDHLSAATKGLVMTGQHDSPARLPTFPTWQGSFQSGGASYPYTMVGKSPQHGGEVTVGTSLIVLNFEFDEFGDANGNPIVIDSSDIVQDVLGSPNFVKSDYTDGHGQFTDAVMRASFYNVMKNNWHTSIDQPRRLTPVTIEVPVGVAQMYDLGNGHYAAYVGFDFLYSQIQTILQLEPVRTDELPILISHNVFADQALGFHDAIEVQHGNKAGIQTYLWSSWLDVDAFGEIYADATTITHEVSEWMADPFINNLTPDWEIPDSGGACGGVLEVGDPIEDLATQMFPITLHNHVYHTQNEVTVAWFSHDDVVPDTFQHTFSYPDTTVMTQHAQSCGSTN